MCTEDLSVFSSQFSVANSNSQNGFDSTLHTVPLIPLPSLSVSVCLFIYELMSKCKSHKLLHIFPRQMQNCFQIDANIFGERKIVQIAKRKLVWNSIFSRWFICSIILFANFREIWEAISKSKIILCWLNQSENQEWNVALKFSLFFCCLCFEIELHLVSSNKQKKKNKWIVSNNFNNSSQLKKNKKEMEILFEQLLALDYKGIVWHLFKTRKYKIKTNKNKIKTN